MKRKRIFYQINIGLMIIIFGGILVLVNLISNRHYKRIDLTKNKIYSLSPQTKNIIKNLKVPVEIIGFYKETSEERKKAEDIFQQYKANSKNISYKFIDPDREPLIVKKYGITTYDTILIKCGEKYEKIYSPEEKEITSAILKLTKDEKKKIYFTKGHGEKDINGYGQKGLSELKKYLEEENYIVREVLILREGIPEDCDILVICGPETDFIDKEIEGIKNYIEKGKRLLVFLEPGNYPLIENLLSDYGIETGKDMVIDLASRRFLGDALSPIIMDYPYHQITKDFNLASIFSTVRSIELKENLPSGIKGDILAKTSSASWAEKNMREIEKGNVKFDKEDESGPISVAVSIEKEIKEQDKTGKARIAVFGDSDFVSDKFINLSGNKDFVLNTIGYLAEEEILISIREKKEENQPLILSQKAGKFIFFFPVVVVPVIIIILGGFINLKRQILY